MHFYIQDATGFIHTDFDLHLNAFSDLPWTSAHFIVTHVRPINLPYSGYGKYQQLTFKGGCMNSFQRRGWVIVLVTVAMVLSSVCAVSAMEQVNINTASVEQLMELDRVGAKYAQRIVEYRETVGPFEKPEDIMNVKGIGEKTWQANKNRIVV